MPIRIQRKREKGWRKPANCRCVTRPGVFGNPFSSAKSFRSWLVDGVIVITDLIGDEWYPWTMESKDRLWKRREAILSRLPELKGLDLACYCGSDADCHAGVLIELANKESEGEK